MGQWSHEEVKPITATPSRWQVAPLKWNTYQYMPRPSSAVSPAKCVHIPARPSWWAVKEGNLLQGKTCMPTKTIQCSRVHVFNVCACVCVWVGGGGGCMRVLGCMHLMCVRVHARMLVRACKCLPVDIQPILIKKPSSIFAVNWHTSRESEDTVSCCPLAGHSSNPVRHTAKTRSTHKSIRMERWVLAVRMSE